MFSFDRKRLPYVIDYVESQQEHHRQRTTIPILERLQERPDTSIRETAAGYQVDIMAWRQEMLDLE